MGIAVVSKIKTQKLAWPLLTVNVNCDDYTEYSVVTLKLQAQAI